MDRRRRRFLRVVALAGATTAAGCGSDSDRVDDDFPPEVARVVLTNRDDAGHAVAVELRETSGDDRVRVGSADALVERTVTLDPAATTTGGGRDPTSEWITDFEGRGDRFVLGYSLDGGERRRFRTGRLRGCTALRVEIGRDGGVNVVTRGTVDCYGGN